MKTEEDACRDAAFDVLLERTLRESATRRATTAEAVAPHADAIKATRGNPRRPRWHSIVLAAAAAVAVIAVSFLQSERDTTRPAQDPETEVRTLTLRSATELRALADDLVAAHAQYVQVVLMMFPVGRVRGQQVRYVDVPDAQVHLESGRELLAQLADAFARPRDASVGHQDAMLDLHLQLTGKRRVVIHCHKTRTQVSISSSGLGLRNVDGKLAEKLLQLLADTKERADATFVLADEAADLANANDSTTQLVSYGVADEDLRPLRRMTGLRRANLVGRRLDEYPQEYVGVSVSAQGLAHLAGCQQLTHLTIESGQLDDNALMTIAGLTALRELVITDGRRCTFTARGLGLLANLPNLHTIQLKGCRTIDDAGLASLARSRCLQSMEIEQCEQVTSTGIARLLAASNLRSLELAEVDIEGLGSSASSTTLRHLELRRCTGRVESLAGMPNLQRLANNSTAMTAAAMASLEQTSLRDVQFSKTPSITQHIDVLTRLPELTNLSLSRSRGAIDWATLLAGLRDCKQLEQLQLLQNQLTDDDVAHLRHLRRLRYLDLRLNRVTPARMRELRTWLPDTQIAQPLRPK